MNKGGSMENMNVTTVTVHAPKETEENKVLHIVKNGRMDSNNMTEIHNAWAKVGENIAVYRDMLNMTMEDLARKVNITTEEMEATENGENEKIEDFMFLYRIAHMLYVNISDLLEYENNKYYLYPVPKGILVCVEKYRVAKKVSVSEMCAKAGISQATYYYWIDEKYNPKIENLAPILSYLKINPNILNSLYNAYQKNGFELPPTIQKKEAAKAEKPAVKKEEPVKKVEKKNTVSLPGIPETSVEIIPDTVKEEPKHTPVKVEAKVTNQVKTTVEKPEKPVWIPKPIEKVETATKKEVPEATPPTQAAIGNDLSAALNEVIYKYVNKNIDDYIDKLDYIIESATKLRDELKKQRQ